MLLLKAARVLHCSSSSSYTRFCMRTRLGSCFWHRTSSSSSSAFSATRPVRSTVDNGPSTASTGGTTARVGGEPELIKKEDSTVPESFLLYEKTSKRLMRISSAVSVVSGFYWVAYVSSIQPHLETVGYEPEPWGYIGLGMTAIMLFSSNTFANKMVGKISYVPASNSLAICTHSFSGRERAPRMVKVGHTSLAKNGEKAKTYIPFKVRGDYAFTLIDQEDGVFHNRDLLLKLLKGNVSEDIVVKKDASGEIVDATTDDTEVQNPKAGKRRRGKGHRRH